MQEIEVISKIQQGEQQYFRELYDLYFDYAVRTASIVLNQQQANVKDAVQETFIRVYRSIGQFQLDQPFKPWFYTILLNECKRISFKNANLVVVGDEINDKYVQPIEDQHHFVQYEALYKAIEQLEEHNRTPIVLKYMNGLKDQEIAAILGENINTIKSRLLKGRKKLKQFLQLDEEGISS